MVRYSTSTSSTSVLDSRLPLLVLVLNVTVVLEPVPSGISTSTTGTRLQVLLPEVLAGSSVLQTCSLFKALQLLAFILFLFFIGIIALPVPVLVQTVQYYRYIVVLLPSFQ
jgi:hypothetical protein